VRFANGKVKEYRTSAKGTPQVGGRYLFFLRAFREGQDYSIVTAYELSGGEVTPVDGTGVKDGGGRLPFDAYIGADEATFIQEVRAALARQAH
jgi:hypothetical protein